MASISSVESFLIIGGCGFLGRTIIDMLLKKGESEVAAFDLVQRELDPRVRFFPGDITDRKTVDDAIQKCNATCVIHTASPVHGLDASIYQKVNVEGTQTVIESCVANNVAKLVYTSSAGVVFDGNDLIDVDERLPYPEKAMDAYNETKATAEEAVLAANGRGTLKTVALRPAGIFGPGDRQAMAHWAKIIDTKRTHFQLGDNTNLFDWTYVENVAHAHILAAEKLSENEKAVDPKSMLAVPLDEITASVPLPRVPTSKARPTGPTLTKTAETDRIERAFRTPEEWNEESRPVLRGRYDQFSPSSIEEAESSPLEVAGQAFFITNGEPVYFWDFARAIWKALGHVPDRRRITISKRPALAIAGAMEWICWLLRLPEPQFTQFRVTFSCANRWYNIEKARRVLGYTPIVGLQEGIEKYAEWWREIGSHSTPAH